MFFKVGEGVGGVGFEGCVEIGELGGEVVDVGSELGVGDFLDGGGHEEFLSGWVWALKKRGCDLVLLFFWCMWG